MMNCQGCGPVVDVEPVKGADKLVSLSSRAAAKVVGLMKQENKRGGLRLEVVPRGCAGFRYGMSFEDLPADKDIVLEEKGVRLFIDPGSVKLLQGTSIDYVESLEDSGFKIDNPNAKSGCGCGKSFS